MRRRIPGLSRFTLLLALVAVAAPAAAESIKFGHVAPPFHGGAKGIDAFAEYVKDKTGGRIEIATFPMGQLGSERSMASQVQSGSLQIAAITTAVMQNFVPQTAVLDMPFIFPNRKAAYATLDDPEVQERLFSYLPKKGFIGIGWSENEIRDFTNTKRPVRAPEDIKGLKVRVMNSPAYLDTFEQLGASSVGIPFPEVYNALETGVIDAQENPLLTSVLMKFTEVAKHVTKTQHALTECIIIVNPDYWNSLSPADQQIFRDAAVVAIQTNREVNAQLHQELPKSGQSIADYCKEKGIDVIELTPAEREKFRLAMVPVWNKYRPLIGEDLFDFMLAKIEKYK
ncbi:MAG: TRAP transporter substrate-binding protein DctP [Deferrisomatales bacterium]|nr:TRAP transporter substrate-binding protein DctP [Deferrisomatales bacterium]